MLQRGQGTGEEKDRGPGQRDRFAMSLRQRTYGVSSKWDQQPIDRAGQPRGGGQPPRERWGDNRPGKEERQRPPTADPAAEATALGFLQPDHRHRQAGDDQAQRRDDLVDLHADAPKEQAEKERARRGAGTSFG